MRQLILILCFFLFATTGFSQAVMKVGYVNMNKAIHLSIEGKKMKKYLKAQAQQLQGALKLKEQEVIQKETGLKNNMMLNQQARSQKQKEIGQMKQALQQELGKAQKILRQDEMRRTTKIFTALKLVIAEIAKAENYDLILELNVVQTILYSKYQMTDITVKVTERFDSMPVTAAAK